MTEQDIIEEVKLDLTGQVLDLELPDTTLLQIVNIELRELTRYWDETKMVTVPFASCIDYSGTPLAESSSIVKVYRTAAYGEANQTSKSKLIDPMFAQQWMLFSNSGTMYNLKDYVLNYSAWSTLTQVKNTLSTDLSFKDDKHDHKLYINQYMSSPSDITIEYIPKLQKAEDIKSDYWQDMLVKLCEARTKIIVGRIRTKYKQSNALWTLDGDTILQEGTQELKDLRDRLRDNSNYIYPID